MDRRSKRYVAIDAHCLLGYGSFHWAWWTGQPGAYSLEIRVDPRHARQGIGTNLFERMRSRLLTQGATHLMTWVRADSIPGSAFAARLGFYETGQAIQEYYLEVASARLGDYLTREERLTRKGLRIASLSELPNNNLDFLRALQMLWADSSDEPPDPDKLRNSFEMWQQEALLSLGLSPDTHWIALDGEQPVGMTFLKRLSETAFENDYTGVASTHRGRGIATALKLRSLAWAQQNGAKTFYTSSEIGNKAMIAINTRVGYVPGAKRIEMERDLTQRDRDSLK